MTTKTYKWSVNADGDLWCDDRLAGKLATGSGDCYRLVDQANQVDTLTAQRDALLAACKSALVVLDHANPDTQPTSRPALFIEQSTFKQIRAALALCERK